MKRYKRRNPLIPLQKMVVVILCVAWQQYWHGCLLGKAPVQSLVAVFWLHWWSHICLLLRVPRTGMRTAAIISSCCI